MHNTWQHDLDTASVQVRHSAPKPKFVQAAPSKKTPLRPQPALFSTVLVGRETILQ